MAAFSFSEFNISPQDIQDYPSFKEYINLEDYINFKKFIFDKYIIGRSNDLDKEIKYNALYKINSFTKIQAISHLMNSWYILKYNKNKVINTTTGTNTDTTSECCDDDFEIL